MRARVDKNQMKIVITKLNKLGLSKSELAVKEPKGVVEGIDLDLVTFLIYIAITYYQVIYKRLFCSYH